MHESEKWKWSRSVVSNSYRPHGLQPTRLLRPWDVPGKSTGVGCYTEWGKKKKPVSTGHTVQDSFYITLLLLMMLSLFSHSVMSDSLWPHGLQHTRLPCPSLQHTTSQSLLKLMSSESVMPFNHLVSVIPVSSCPQSFPASGSFLMSWLIKLFAAGCQSIGASESGLPMNIQGWFPLGLTGLISL